MNREINRSNRGTETKREREKGIYTQCQWSNSCWAIPFSHAFQNSQSNDSFTLDPPQLIICWFVYDKHFWWRFENHCVYVSSLLFSFSNGFIFDLKNMLAMFTHLYTRIVQCTHTIYCISFSSLESPTRFLPSCLPSHWISFCFISFGTTAICPNAQYNTYLHKP